MNFRFLPLLFRKVAVSHRLGLWVYKLVGGYLILAAIGKILEPSALDEILKFNGVEPFLWRRSAVGLLIVWEFGLGMVILCVCRVRLPAMAASCTSAVFAVQKSALWIGDGPEGCGCLGSFTPAAVLFPEGISPTALPVNLALAGFVGLAAAAKPQWFASTRTVGDSRLRRHFALSCGGFSGRLRRNVCGLIVVRIRIGQLQLMGYQCKEISWDADPGICRIRGLTTTGNGDSFGV